MFAAEIRRLKRMLIGLGTCIFVLSGVAITERAFAAPPAFPSTGCFYWKDYIDPGEPANGILYCEPDVLNFSVEYNYGVVTGTGICSTDGYGNGGGELDTPTSNGGQYCWCSLTGYDNGMGSSFTGSSTYALFSSDFGTSGDCAMDCGCQCADFLSNEGLGKLGDETDEFCIGAGNGCTTLLTLNPHFCDLELDAGSDDGNMEWSSGFLSGDALKGESRCTDQHAANEGDIGTPGSTNGQYCWCRATQYYDGTNTYTASTSDWFYMTDLDTYGNCTDKCPTTCAKDFVKKYLCDLGAGQFCLGDAALHVTYSCNGGGGTAPTDSNDYDDGDTVITVSGASNTCTPPTNQVFLGWNCGGTFVPAGGTFTINDNTTCNAVYSTFSVGTTSISSGGTFTFQLSAQGTFYVNCGTGGTLSGPSGSGVSGNTITKNDTTQYTYTCTYSGSAGTKLVSFGGVATGYNPTNNGWWTFVPPIRFAGNIAVVSLNGNLSVMFPVLGSSMGQFPIYYNAFADCTSLTTISSTLFANYTGNLSNQFYMFENAFNSCTSLQTIPAGLFTGITAASLAMFSGTFAGCSSLTTIPSNLFAGITAGNANAFASTFSSCTSLQTIPSGLFTNITSGGNSMFAHTFTGSGLTGTNAIPSNLFAGITTGAQEMFRSTFEGCANLTAIPSGLFSNITTGAYGMFYGTFSGCTGLTAIPSGLFANITTAADYMFEYTFASDTGLTGYIPPDLFAGLTPKQASYPATMMSGTFSSCTNLATSCPSGTATYTTGYESYWDSHVSCSTAYTVSYACGAHGSGSPTDSNSPYLPNATVTTLASSACTADTGYNFSAWNCGNSVNSGNNITAGNTFSMPASNVTCTAQWTPKTTTITYDCGTGSIISGQSGNMSQTFTYGEYYMMTGANTLCQKTGYRAGTGGVGTLSIGWSCSPSVSTWTGTWADDDHSSITCTAQWFASSYIVTYNCNGGSAVSGATMSVGFQYDSSYSLAAVADKCARLGYDPATGGSHNVGGWVCTVDAQADMYLGAASGTWTYTNDYTCRAQWRTHTTAVTYNCNGGSLISGQSSSTTFTFDTSYTVPDASTKCTRNGYSLKTSGTNIIANGWMCSLGSGYLNSATGMWSSMENTMTCNAQWNQNYVTYSCGAHGTIGVADLDYPTYGGSYTVRTYAGAGCTIDAGYTFNNWNCVNISGSTVNQTWNAGQTVNPWNYNANIRCTAQYTANTYTLTYNVNAPYGSRPSGSTASTTATMGQSATVATNGFSVSGWNFASWRCTNTTAGIDVTFSSGQTVNPWIYPANLTCAAQWTQDTTQYTVSYNCGQNGSGTAPASQSFMLNQAYTLADAPGSCVGTAGYKFNGWTCTNGLSGALNANGTPASGTWSLTSNSVCHPSWTAATANTINLSWAATNSGQPGWTAPSGTPDSCSYGSTFTPVPTAPTKNGYHFTGWNVVGNWFKTHAYYIYSAYYFSKVLSSGSTICKQGTYSSGEYSTSTVNCSSNSSVFNKLSLYDWAAEKAYHYYYGTSLCSMTPIVVGQNIGTPSNTAGRFCWCKLTGYAELTGMYQSESFQAVDNMPWVHMNCFAGGVMYPGYDSTTHCQLNCASKCAEAASLSSSAYPLYNGSSNSNTTFGPCVDINVQLPEGR